MTTYTFETLGAGAEALRQAAIKTACMQAAIPVGPDAEQSGQQKLDVAKIEEFFAGVPAMFYPFMDMPAPDDFQVAVETLRTSAQVLMTTQNSPEPSLNLDRAQNDRFSGVTTVGDNLASWSGAAAREFKQNYLDKLPMQSAGQFNAVVTCMKLFQQEQLIWQEARKNVAELLNLAIDVMHELPQRCSKNTWTVTLTVIAAVATIAAVPLAGAGAAVALGLAVTDGAASTVSALAPDDPPKRVNFKASTADGVIREVARGMRELIDRIDEQERKIAQVLRGVDAVIQGQRAAFVPKRPLLAGATEQNVTGQNYLGFTS
jgi:hypothetical protein